MKSLLCWIVAIALVFIGVTGIHMHQFVIGAVFIALAVAAVLASGGTKKASTSRR